MHTEPMPESAGTLTPTNDGHHHCYGCGKSTAKCESWNSSCGGYTDYKYTCTDPACGKVRWEEGSDA